MSRTDMLFVLSIVALYFSGRNKSRSGAALAAVGIILAMVMA